MEMDPVNSDDNSTEEPSFEQLILPSSPEISGISGEPQVYPRVGDEYQAEIPPMISETENFQLPLNPCDSEGIFDGYDFFVGLPMPVTWVRNKRNAKDDEGRRTKNTDYSPNANKSMKSRTSRKNDTLKKKDLQQNTEAEDLVMDGGQESKPIGTKVEMKDERNYLVPGSLYHAWTDAEVNSFILGLYIFRKNFVQIKRFLGKKEMGDILSFYYGEFYRSDGYHRWSDCRKTRRKKCVYGRKLFRGWRQEELVSRLHPSVPEHSQNALLEVSTAFSEGKFSLEEYVCELKTIAGIQALVDAIGIGKGKTDLTSLSVEPGKSNLLFTVCPSGKTCSSLTCSDIIKLLTGGFRLSKARCNDIFWDAVWPRLLARGWHSEQPKSQSYLVFLIPGIKKFSKRRLSKGKHYFDSVSDVLNKVACEPKLIELEDEEARANEEENSATEVPSGQGDPSIQQTHRYLKPRVPNLKVARFTVVDSSFIDGGTPCKMREMRYLPHDLKVKSLFTTLSSGIEMKFLDYSESNDERIAVNKSSDGSRKKASDDCCSDRTKFTIVDTSLMHGGNSSKVRELRYASGMKVTSEMKNSRKRKKRPSKGSSDVQVSDVKSKLLNEEKNICKSNQKEDTIDSCESDEPLNRKFLDKFVESLQDKHSVSDKNQSARTIKHQFSRRSKSGHSNNLVPIVKRRRLTACSNTDISRVIKNFSDGQGSKREGSCCSLNSPDRSGNTCEGNPPQKSSFATSFSLVREGLEEESSRSMSGKPCLGVETSHGENVEHRNPSCIDLNQPQVPPKLENDEPAEQPNPEALSASTTDVSPNPRRQSKRNRPLTTRALEALEYGFISMKRQKSMRVHRHELSASGTSCSVASSVNSKTKGTSKRVNMSSKGADVEEEDANGDLEMKDLVDEIPEGTEKC